MMRAFILLALAVLFGCVVARAETLDIPEDVPTIQVAQRGATVRVAAAGTYRERRASENFGDVWFWAPCHLIGR